MTANDDQLVTARALADLFDLSVETIWRYTREGKIPYVEVGGRHYRYRVKEVLAAMGEPGVREKSGKYEIDPPECSPDAERTFTYEDYLALPEESGHRFEVLNGTLIREPSPSVTHQRVSRRLQRLLEDYFLQADPDGEIFDAPLDVTMGQRTVVQPDLFLVSGKQQRIIKENRIDGAPELIVEVLSPSHPRKDRLEKMQVYQKNGVEHYWLVDPHERTMECLALAGDVYSVVAVGMDDDTVSPPGFEELDISLEGLWA